MLEQRGRSQQRQVTTMWANIDSGPFNRHDPGAQQALLISKTIRVPLAEFGTQVVVAYGRAMARTGVDGSSSRIFCALWGRFEDHSAYDQRVIAALRAEGVDAFLHVCGDQDTIDGWPQGGGLPEPDAG
jgi:hypothetical protein